MQNLLAVGIGGFLGSIARYYLSSWAAQEQPFSLPYQTLTVNLLGCLLIGFLGGLAEWTKGVRLFLFAGLLGGFTTFSAFGQETFALAEESRFGAAAANILLQVGLGLLAVWAGTSLSRILNPS